MSTEGVPKKGEVLAGKFQVEDVLGAGGMGIVVAARDLALRRRVAVKFLSPQVARLPEASARFLREARAAVAIQSEHVARVIDIGTMPSGSPYMVMEFLAGTDFSKVLKQRGALPIPEALDFVLQAGEAIAEAHALGIVHRDLKPGNLFLTTRTEGSPLVKVLDFGLSKMTVQGEEAPEGSLTATGFVAGSPFYMAPEQVRSLRDVDWRVDIWALGVILYELLTAKRPFDGPTLTAVCASIIADTPHSMRALRPEIPEEVERAVMLCLEKDVNKRARSVAELAQAIGPFAPPSSLGSVGRIARLVPGAATAPLPDASEDAADAAATLLLPSGSARSPASQSEEPIAPAGQGTEVLRSDPAISGAPVDKATSQTGQSASWGQTNPGVKRSPVGLIAGVMAALAVVLGIVVWVLRSGDAAAPAPAAPTATTAAAPAVTAMATAAVSPPVVEPAPEPTATASAGATAVAAVPPKLTATPRAEPAKVEATKASQPRVEPSKVDPPKKPEPAKPPSKAPTSILDKKD